MKQKIRDFIWSFLMVILLIQVGPLLKAHECQAIENEVNAVISLLLADTVKGVRKKVHITWKRPFLRTNGDTLTEAEIDFYRLRYKASAERQYHFLLVDSPQTDASKEITAIAGAEYEFSVQAVDLEGYGSKFTSPTTVKF